MGDPLGSFLQEHASEDKARWKDSCWSVGTVGQIWDVTQYVFDSLTNRYNSISIDTLFDAFLMYFLDPTLLYQF